MADTKNPQNQDKREVSFGLTEEQVIQTEALQGATLMEWEADEYEQEQHDENWYLAGGIIAAILVAGSIVFRNYLSAVTFLLLAIVIYLYANRKPEKVAIQLKEFGVRVNDQFFPYQNMNRFWIIYKPGDVQALNFQTDSILNPVITLLIKNQDPNKLRELLQDKLPEDLKQEEGNIEQLARRFKI
jgi:hypothetical protein